MIRAVGAGMNQSAMLARFAREGDFDVFLVAGRYTLLDQDGAAELLPAVPRARDRRPRRRGDEQRRPRGPADPAPRSTTCPRRAEIIDRARRLGAVCARHGVPLRAAAIQFPLAHPAVVSLIAGVRRIDHLDEYPAAHAPADPARRSGTTFAPRA